MKKSLVVLAGIILFSMWESPSGLWTRQGRGSSESQPDAYSAAAQYCKADTIQMTLATDMSRVFVQCEAR